jgi:hypothetical protein
VLTSVYQAEWPVERTQITAVTKSGTNRFRGSVYRVQRDSDWWGNSVVNKKNGDPKGVLKEKDQGYSIGGPIGKPGGTNKLFFFYSQEFSPRTAGNDVRRYRFPTALERAGDFSQTLDQNGALYNFIKDPLINGTCSAADQTACFKDGACWKIRQIVSLGRPQRPEAVPRCPTLAVHFPYNYEVAAQQSILSCLRAVRYQRRELRATVRRSGWQQRRDVVGASASTTQMQRPVYQHDPRLFRQLQPEQHDVPRGHLRPQP